MEKGFKYSDLVSYANAMDQLSGQEIEENRFASFMERWIILV